MLLDTPSANIGSQAKSFNLVDTTCPDGKEYTLEKIQGKSGTVVAFICNHCPYVKAIASRLVEDAKILQSHGIGVVAINSNDAEYVAEDSPDQMALFAARHGFTFPYLVDEDQSVGRAYGAVCTPDFFGFNADGALQYRGRLDDAQMGDATNRVPELVNAMLAIKETGAGPYEQFPSIGCSIKWKR